VAFLSSNTVSVRELLTFFRRRVPMSRLLSITVAVATLSATAWSGAAQADDAVPGQPAAVALPAAVSVAQPNTDNFLHRFFKAYYDELNPPPNAPPSPDSPRRIPPAPLDSPPFPSSDWGYGGSPVLGTDGSLPVTPLMKALHGTDAGTVLENNRISIYGWFEPGGNISTSHGKAGNFPAAYDYNPNTVNLDQFTLYVERQPDTNQRDHTDWGFRVTGIYGTDYRYTTALGYNSDAFLNRNHEYGVDVPMAYVDYYVPWIGYGTDFRLGRYISLPDIEAQLAPNNYFFSHSLLYTYDPFTQTGLVATTMLDPKGQWIVQLGVSAGNDASPLSSAAQPTLTAMVRYSTPSNLDNFYVGVNSLNDGKFSYNNLQSFYTTWYHKFGNSGLHMATEAWYMYEFKTPVTGSDTGFGRNGPFGATCHTGTSCYSDEYAFLNYLNYEFDPQNFIGLRNEAFNDEKGQRTGFATLYSEHTISYNHFFSNSIQIRPELRYEHSYDLKAYNSGRSSSQETAAMDLILKY
jgi:hypothetical protein